MPAVAVVEAAVARACLLWTSNYVVRLQPQQDCSELPGASHVAEGSIYVVADLLKALSF